MVLQNAFRLVLSRPITVLERCADNGNIPEPENIFHPIGTAEVSSRCFLSLCRQLFLQCRLSRIDWVLTHNGCSGHLHKLFWRSMCVMADVETCSILCLFPHLFSHVLVRHASLPLVCLPAPPRILIVRVVWIDHVSC